MRRRHRSRSEIEWRLDATHRPRLKALRYLANPNRRCFILGAAEGTDGDDVRPLSNEVAFAVDRAGLRPDLDWMPAYWVVTDSVFAEKHRSSIADARGCIKLVASDLAHCMDEDDRTVFFDQRSVCLDRNEGSGTSAIDPPFPGTDPAASTAVQLALYLGYRQIYLVGIDEDLVDSPAIHRKMARMISTVGARVTNAGGSRGLDGSNNLDLQMLFAAEDLMPTGQGAMPMSEMGSSEIDASRVWERLPRLVIFDTTLMGDGTATGELKSNLLCTWERSDLLHVFRGNRRSVRVRCHRNDQISDAAVSSHSVLNDIVDRFEPACALYRPVPDDPRVHSAAMAYLRTHAVPLVIWIMDDWPEFLRTRQDVASPGLEEDLRWLMQRATRRLVISEAMREAFEERYGWEFTTVANGVDAWDWQDAPVSQRTEMVVRYAGSLAKNMTFDSVLRVARGVDALARCGNAIRFEVNTGKAWLRDFMEATSDLHSCSVGSQRLPPEDYKRFLREADVLLVAYNFDASSVNYVRYSMANKLPECLISNAVLVHGPVGVATVRLISDAVPEAVVSDPCEHDIVAWLSGLLQSPDKLRELSARCRIAAEQTFPLRERCRQFADTVVGAAAAPHTGTVHLRKQSLSTTLNDFGPPGGTQLFQGRSARLECVLGRISDVYLMMAVKWRIIRCRLNDHLTLATVRRDRAHVRVRRE